MRISIVLNFDVPTPEASVEVLRAINPPALPYFVDETHVVPDPHATDLKAWLSGGDAPDVDPADPALARLEQLVRDFDHYANHGDPDHGMSGYFRTLHGHLTSTFLLASGRSTLLEVVDELESHDREIANEAIAHGLTTAVGTRRPGAGFGL